MELQAFGRYSRLRGRQNLGKTEPRLAWGAFEQLQLTIGTPLRDTGVLDTQAIAVDGEDIVPFAGHSFELAVPQRLDLRVHIPAGEGSYPVLAQGEGTNLRTGLTLATPNATIPVLSQRADTVAGALTNAQERLFNSGAPPTR